MASQPCSTKSLRTYRIPVACCRATLPPCGDRHPELVDAKPGGGRCEPTEYAPPRTSRTLYAAVTSIPSRARRLATSSTSTATLTRLLTTIGAPLENPFEYRTAVLREHPSESPWVAVLLRLQVRASARAAVCGRRMRARDRPEGHRGGRHKVCRENDGCARELPSAAPRCVHARVPCGCQMIVRVHKAQRRRAQQRGWRSQALAHLRSY